MVCTAPSIAPIRNDVADVNPYAKFNAAIFGYGGAACGHATLDFHRATHGIDRACKFDERTVACGLHDTAAVFGNLWIDEVRDGTL
jgi:hypothetical protein